MFVFAVQIIRAITESLRHDRWQKMNNKYYRIRNATNVDTKSIYFILFRPAYLFVFINCGLTPALLSLSFLRMQHVVERC